MGRRQPWQSSVCSVLQQSEFWQPVIEELLRRSLHQHLHFPFREFTWLPLNTPIFLAWQLFCRLWCSYLHLLLVLYLYTTMSKTFREHLDYVAFHKTGTTCLCKIKSRTNSVEVVSVESIHVIPPVYIWQTYLAAFLANTNNWYLCYFTHKLKYLYFQSVSLTWTPIMQTRINNKCAFCYFGDEPIITESQIIMTACEILLISFPFCYWNNWAHVITFSHITTM